MALDSQSRAFMTDAVNTSDDFMEKLERLVELSQVYTARGYSSLSDADLEEFCVTSAQLVSFINFCMNVLRFIDNDAALVQGDYRTIVNQFRHI